MCIRSVGNILRLNIFNKSCIQKSVIVAYLSIQGTNMYYFYNSLLPFYISSNKWGWQRHIIHLIKRKYMQKKYKKTKKKKTEELFVNHHTDIIMLFSVIVYDKMYLPRSQIVAILENWIVTISVPCKSKYWAALHG